MPARTKRVVRAILIACLAAAALPAASQAANVSVSGNTLTFTAAANEANDVVVQKLDTGYRISESATTISTAAPCTPVNSRQVTCPLGTINLVRLSLLGQDDSARVVGAVTTEIFGGRGTDALVGGNGHDLLSSGAGQNDQLIGNEGNDKLDASGAGGSQYLSGGSGNDTLTAGDVETADGYSGTFTQLEGGPGTDTLIGSSQSEYLMGGPGPDVIDGGSGGVYGGESVDIAAYEDHAEAVTVTTADGAANDGSASDGPVGARDKVLRVEGVIGTAFNDIITGSAAADTIYAYAGNDTVNGGGGRDMLCGEGYVYVAPDVSYFGGSCYDNDTGNDALNGGDGDDQLIGNAGADVLNGGNGTDAIAYNDKSNPVAVTLGDALANDGEADVDTGLPGLQPEGDRAAAVESVIGGSGNDTLNGTTASNVLWGGPGDDTLNGLAGDDAMCGDSSVYIGLTVERLPVNCNGGGSLNSPSADVLNGGFGDDTMGGGARSDTFNGGAGGDIVTYADQSSGVAVTIDGAFNDGRVDQDAATPGDQPENDKVATDVENVVGTYYGDTLSGSAGANQLSGSGGTDTLNGLGGNDVLDPGYGAGDIVNGGAGFDYGTYTGYAGGSGINVTLDGVANDGPKFTTENDQFKTDVEGVIGTRGPDILAGPTSVTANTLVGNGGGDSIDGNDGDDALTGGAGNDTVLGDAGNDLLALFDGDGDTGDCGEGTGDRAMHDSAFDIVSNCETTQMPLASTALAPVADPRSAEFRALERTAARVGRLSPAR